MVILCSAGEPANLWSERRINLQSPSIGAMQRKHGKDFGDGRAMGRSKSMTLPGARQPAIVEQMRARTGQVAQSPTHGNGRLPFLKTNSQPMLPPLQVSSPQVGRKRMPAAPPPPDGIANTGASHGGAVAAGRHQFVEDVNPMLHRYDHLRRVNVGHQMDGVESGLGKSQSSQGSFSQRGGRGLFGPSAASGNDEETFDSIETPAETENWMHNVMASVRGQRKALLAPLPSAEAGDSSSSTADPSLAADKADQQSVPKDFGEDEDVVKAPVSARSTKTNPNEVPDAEEVLRKFTNGEGFSPSELARLRSTFNRFKVPDTAEVHKDDLTNIMVRLGYMMVDEEELRKMVDDVTIYSTLDFNEFVSLAEKFSDHEKGKFFAIFQRFDEDNSGQLSTVEVEKLMLDIGFTPLKSVLKESLDFVDKDGSGQVSFEEFIHLMAIYRSSEGFNKKEINSLRKIYQSEAGGQESLSAQKLKEVLLHFYGPNSAKLCTTLGTEAIVGSRKDADESDSAAPPALHFPEVLIWARRLREAEFDNYKAEFAKQDRDNSGFIDLQELQNLLTDFGFTLPRKTIDEFIAAVDDDWVAPDSINSAKQKDGKLDYDEFVNLMILLRDSDGFSKAELAEFKSTFIRFDDDSSGDVDVLEMSDMLRYLGHLTKLDDVHQLIAKVDFNGSGALDFREFIRLMRLHREKELKGIKQAFERHKDVISGRISNVDLDKALKDCDCSAPRDKQGSGSDAKAQNEGTDLDAFVAMVDEARAIRVAEGRRRAGFTHGEIDRFRKMFAAYDLDSSGEIDAKEVANLLGDLGFKMGTKEERDNVLGQIDKARAAAAEVGVKHVGQMGDGNVGFWVLIQLLRVLYNRDDKRVLDREAHAAEQSRFSSAEIEEFREVFMSWWYHEKNFEDEEDADVGKSKPQEPADPNLKEISKDGMRRLLRSLGVTLTPGNRVELEKHVDDVADSHGKVDFAAFLRLMRWMLDTNFADINKAAATATR